MDDYYSKLKKRFIKRFIYIIIFIIFVTIGISTIIEILSFSHDFAIITSVFYVAIIGLYLANKFELINIVSFDTIKKISEIAFFTGLLLLLQSVVILLFFAKEEDIFSYSAHQVSFDIGILFFGEGIILLLYIQYMENKLVSKTYIKLHKGEKSVQGIMATVIWVREKRECLIYFTNRRVIIEQLQSRKRKRKILFESPLHKLKKISIIKSLFRYFITIKLEFTDINIIVKTQSPRWWKKVSEKHLSKNNE